MIKFETIYEGTTFLGAEIAILEEDESGVETPMIITGADVLMNIRRKGDDVNEATYSTSDNTLSIEDNTIVIPQHIPTLEFGKYEFDFNIIISPEVILTGIAGGEWEILNPVTKR